MTTAFDSTSEHGESVPGTSQASHTSRVPQEPLAAHGCETVATGALPGHLQNLEEIENVFLHVPGCDCFVCSRTHGLGFRLRFFRDRAAGLVRAAVPPVRLDFSSFPGVLHGGFQAMLLDEVMAWAALGLAGKMTFTARMETRFRGTVHTNEPLELAAGVERAAARLILCHGRILVQGETRAEATGTFYVPTPEEFRGITGVAEVPESVRTRLR